MKDKLIEFLVLTGAVLMAGSVYVGTIALLLYLFMLATGSL